MDDKIVRVAVYAVGTRHDWKLYTEGDALHSTLTIVKITTANGLEGVGGVSTYTSFANDSSTAVFVMDHLAPVLLASDPFAREALWARLIPDVYPTPMAARAVVDIALWDLVGKKAGLPIHALLGGARRSLPVQWSSPVFDDIPGYLQWVDEAQRAGCRAMKLHCWNDFERDIKLVKAVRAHAPNATFMLDVEQAYDPTEAQRMARALHSLNFAWFEAPLRDTDTPGYKALTAKSDIPILPGGNSITDLTLFTECARQRCWSVARFDVTGVGGLTPARKFFAVAEANHLRVEVQSWGHTLVAAANLHLMMGLGAGKLGPTVFEWSTPAGEYEVGMLDTIRPDEHGMIHAPSEPGLGVRVDWPAMSKAAFFHRVIELDEPPSGGTTTIQTSRL